jgi:hypothetical protein
MFNRYMQYVISAAVMLALLNGCATTPAPTPSVKVAVKSFKDYPDHAFDPKEYVQGMEKGGHNVLIWQDPSVDLRKYASVNVADFRERLLPEQTAFSYDPYIKSFNSRFRSFLTLSQEESANALLIEGEMVECNPGSRATRYLVGFGAGKASGAVACEVYEPGKSRPSMRIYVRDRASMGMFGGDSIAMINHIFEQIAMRLGTVLDERIGR